MVRQRTIHYEQTYNSCKQTAHFNECEGRKRPSWLHNQIGFKNQYAREVLVDGPSKMVYNGKQLNCGARAWLETESDITLIDEMTFKEARAVE